MMKLLKVSIPLRILCLFFFGQNTFAQTDSLTIDILQVKLELDSKVSLSKNYLKVSGYTTLTSLAVTIITPNVISFGVTIAGVFTTPYHLVRHLIFLKRRKIFYKKNNIPLQGGKVSNE